LRDIFFLFLYPQTLVDHGVYPEEYEHPDGREAPTPNNWEEINKRLMQPRPSLSPSKFSDGAFKDFKKTNAHAFTEEDIMTSVIPIVSGSTKSDRSVARDIKFGNLDPLTDGGLVSGQPDIFYGARPEQLDRRIRRELAGRIIPSTQEDVPMVPNFYLEAKGPDGSLAVAGRQACYDGALGARGIHSLQSFGTSEPVYDNNAYTIASTYHGGTLKMYTTHPTESQNPHRQSDYHTNPLRGWLLTDSAESFRQGARAYRNARDWAREQRNRLIQDANDKAQIMSMQTVSFETSNTSQVSISTIAAIPLESDTSADELALDEGAARNTSRKRARRFPSRSTSRTKHGHEKDVTDPTQGY
jgi:hypothetical protein